MDRWNPIKSRLKSAQSALMILITLGYLLGTHLSTINSLEMALVSKADRSQLDLLDKRPTRIEVKLEQAIMTKNEMTQLREHIDRKLTEMSVGLNHSGERGISHGK